MAKVKLLFLLFNSKMTLWRPLRTSDVEYFGYFILKNNRVLTLSFERDEVDHHVVVENDTTLDSPCEGDRDDQAGSNAFF